MSTFMFKNKSTIYTPVSNVFIDKYLPIARGDFVKVYILGLKYCLSGELGINSTMLASTLHLLESDVMNAWNYWSDEGVIKFTPIDSMGNYNIEFLALEDVPQDKDKNINLLKELNNNSTKGMLQEIENLLARPLSPKEMTMYLGWQHDYDFSPELILLLIQYCVSKGKTNPRYIEKIAICWNEEKIKTVEDAQIFIKKHEDKWISIRKILTYLGIRDAEIMKPQETMIDKWISTYKFPLNMIFRACDICFERINKSDFKYIDAILASWYKSGIKTLEDVDTKNTTFKKNSSFKKKNFNNTKAKGNFNNYEQRNYDFDDLEKKLLGWDKK